MRIAIASGKGGTGKTTVAASLVSIWPKKLAAVDMDVEAPNLHLFLNPVISNSSLSTLEVPVIDERKCNYCGICSEFCQFSAITLVGNKVLTFSEMCHGCGGCVILCPEKAIHTNKRSLGEILYGNIRDNIFLMGKLRIGEAMSPPLMRHINRQIELAGNEYDFIVDCPPGTSCPAINAVSGSDLILLVTESTPFGVYDLELAYKSFSKINIPMVVIINRFGLGDDKVLAFCKKNNLPIICKIPYDEKIAITYSRGELITNTSEEIRTIFLDLYSKLQTLVK